MSSGFIGGLGGVAGSVYAQRHAADSERSGAENASESRQSQAQQAAESAAGIGETHEEQGAGDRDADGRRLWERTQPPTETEATGEETTDRVSDPDELRGGSLDLTG